MTKKEDENYGLQQYELGCSLMEQGNYSSAYTAFINAEIYHVESVDLYRNMAKIEKSLGLFQEALEDYKKVIELNPNDAIAHNNLGNIYYKIGDYTHALLSYEVAISIDKTFSVAIENRWKTYMKFGENPNIEESKLIYYNKGKKFFENKDYENAIIEFDNVGSNQYCRFFRGLAYKMIKDIDNAKQEFDFALDMNSIDFLIDKKEQNIFEQICHLEILECEGIEIPEYIQERKILKQKKEQEKVKKLLKEINGMFESDEKINIETCKKKDLLKLDCFDTEIANKFLKFRREGKHYYDIETLAKDLELQPHEIIEIEEKIIFPPKPKSKMGRKIDW